MNNRRHRRRVRRARFFRLEIPWKQVWPLVVIAGIGLIILLTPRGNKHFPPYDGLEPVYTPAATPLPVMPAQPQLTAEPIGPPVAGPVISVYDADSKEVFQIPLETYLIGVVAGEVPMRFADEAIKAQSVAARTYTLKKLAAFGGDPCGRGGADICTDSSHCQAYRTDAQLREGWGGDYEANRARLVSLIHATAGKAVTYRGEAIEAFFHSTSGGHTENSENAFSEALPYLRGVASPGEESAPRFQGEMKFSRERFADKINDAYDDADLVKRKLEEDVSIRSRFESGRVDKIRLGGVTVDGTDLRRLLGLDSSNFRISFERDSIVFSTTGFGHGVGMSQMGADYMARTGSSYEQILAHYYTGTELSTVYTQ